MHKPLSIFRIDMGGGPTRGPRTAIVVASSATAARRFAAEAARANGHPDPDFFLRMFHVDMSGSICLRIGVTTPLGGCRRPGEILRLDASYPMRLKP